MKKYLVIIMAACCLLSGCGLNGQEAQSAEAAQSSIEAVRDDNFAVVKPLPATTDMAGLGNCTVAVSIDKGNIYRDDSGKVQIRFTVYDYDLYDMVDIAALKIGDSITILGGDIAVVSLERDDSGRLIINGGLDVGGYELRTDGTGVYYQVGYNDAKSYYPIGEAVFGVASDFVFTDGIDFDGPPATYSAQELLAEDSGIFFHFVPYNTKLVIENGTIIAMERVYMP